jgi:hypothetical protein
VADIGAPYGGDSRVGQTVNEGGSNLEVNVPDLFFVRNMFFPTPSPSWGRGVLVAFGAGLLLDHGTQLETNQGEVMKVIFKVALAVAILASSVSAHAQAPTGTSKTSSAPKKQRMHDGCHSRAAQMSGKPCR